MCMKPKLSFQTECLCRDCTGEELEITEVIVVDQLEIPDNVIYVDFQTKTVTKRGA